MSNEKGVRSEATVADRARLLAFKVAQGVRQLEAMTREPGWHASSVTNPNASRRSMPNATWADLSEAYDRLGDFLAMWEPDRLRLVVVESPDDEAS